MMTVIRAFRRTLLLGLIWMCFFSATEPKPPSSNNQAESPKNIILLIGDGMGVSQMSAAFYYGDTIPNFARFPVVGLITTSSCSDKVTDSAAGATAFSTGKKTNNKRIGRSPDNKDLENLVEYFSRQGKANGMVATSTISHATPAAFYAHRSSRYRPRSIARQLPEAPLDFFAGGGLKDFRESDFVKFQKQGIQVYTDSLREMEDIEDQDRVGFLLAEGHMPAIYQGRKDYLTRATNLAMSFLSQEDSGFFLMVEGSQIDLAGHANNVRYLIDEVLDFDEAVGAALDFAEKDGNTLVIVTADHETGGFTLGGKETSRLFGGGIRYDYDNITPSFATAGHSAALVPVLAFGPGAEAFGGIYPNIDLHKKMLKALEAE